MKLSYILHTQPTPSFSTRHTLFYFHNLGPKNLGYRDSAYFCNINPSSPNGTY
jgi:hypothetical protein